MRFLPPLLLIAVTLICSPFMGLLRDAIFDRLGTAAVKTIAAGLVALAALTLVWTLGRIREGRKYRYGGLLVVLALLVVQSSGMQTGFADVDVVEKIHIVQYGLLAALFYRALGGAGGRVDAATLALPVLWSGLAGVGEESVQAFFQLRVGDVRDIGLNLFAALCGLIFALSLAPPRALAFSSPPESWRRVGRWAVLLLMSMGTFLHLAQFGHLIEDPEIGKFRSWFTTEQLESLGLERSGRWQKNPPTGLVAWQPKDYYLVEAARHANHRNTAYRDGHWTQAWQANRILERYYEPFLELTSFRHGGRHRYPPARRLELEHKAKPDPAHYFSPVQKGRVLLWPRGPFWTALVAASILCLALPSWLIRREQQKS